MAWMEQVGIEWMSQVAPHDNYGRIVSRWYKVGEAQREIALPKNAIRMTMIGLKFGEKFYELTLDPTLAMPDSLQFSCDPNGGSMDTLWPGTNTYAPFRTSEAYNTNYYRIQDGIIKFNPAPPSGHLYLEWLEGGGYAADTVVHAGYVDCLRLYMTWQYYEQMCSSSADENTNDFYKWSRLAKDFERQYDERMRIANMVVKCPTIGQIMDVIRGFG
jgi:hypothetical protein